MRNEKRRGEEQGHGEAADLSGPDVVPGSVAGVATDAPQHPHQPVERQREAKGHCRRAEHDHSSAHLCAQQRQSKERKKKKRAGSHTGDQAKANRPNNGQGRPRVEIQRHFRQGKILNLNDGLSDGRENQRVVRSRERHGARLQVCLDMVVHRYDHITVKNQRDGQRPQRPQHGGPPEEDDETLFRPCGGDKQHQREKKTARTAKRGQDIGQTSRQSSSTFTRTGGEQGHASKQERVEANEIGEHGVPFHGPPAEEAACAEQGDPQRPHDLLRTVRRGIPGGRKTARQFS